MSMLAEPKRKVRYHINPNGNTWANDTNALGKKMLEKMGWSKGKGLGANLDGMTSHIKVSYKSDQQGMGFKDRNDQWTAHEDNFSQLLKNLQAEGHAIIKQTEELSCKSLEMKSKSSRARVHYRKFTQGKDLSRYSRKDLANIFGRKTIKKEGIEDEKSKEEINKDGKKFGVETLHGGNMADYFKKKMGQIKSNFGGKVSVKVEEGKDDDDYDARPSFGFGFTPSKIESHEDASENTIQEVCKKVKKRKLNNFEETECQKPKKAKIEGFMNGGYEDPEDNCDSGVSVDDPDGDNAENPYEIKPKKKKSKKRAKSRESGLENPNFNEEEDKFVEVSHVVNPYEVVVRQKKKKKGKADTPKEATIEGVENPMFRDVSTASEDADTTQEIVNPYETVQKRKKLKKKNKNKALGIVNPMFEATQELIAPEKALLNPCDDEITPIKKKKKDKRRSLEDSFTIEEVQATPEVPTTSETKKKKKKSQNFAPCNCEDDNVCATDTNLIKTKKIHSLTSTEGNDSQLEQQEAMNCSQAASPKTPTNNYGICDDLIMNVASFEVKPILQTPQSQKSKLKRRKSVRIDESLNQEHIIPNIQQQKQMEQENQQHRNELFDINVGVIERSLEEHRKQSNEQNNGIANEAFNVQSVDHQSFHDKKLEVRNPTKKQHCGIANPAFNNKQENVENVKRKLDNCQAEVENDINEGKRLLDTRFIGTLAELNEHTMLPNGHIKLAFSRAHLPDKMNHFDMKSKNVAKRGYRHLVKGDIELEMKGTNLHQLLGYATVEYLAEKKQKKQIPVIKRQPMPQDLNFNMEKFEHTLRKLNVKRKKKQKRVESRKFIKGKVFVKVRK